MSQWTQEQVSEAMNALSKKAMTDETFRSLCLTDAAAAVKQVTGQELPEGLKLRFVENEGADLTVVLPDLQKSEELSDAQLESVAGGAHGGVQVGNTILCIGGGK